MENCSVINAEEEFQERIQTLSPSLKGLVIVISNPEATFPSDVKRVRIRYEVPKSLSPDFVYKKTEECLLNFISEINSKNMFMDETTLNTYVMIVSVYLTPLELKTTKSDIINEIKVNLEKFRIKVSPIQD